MMEKYGKQYREAMDQVTLSDTADEKILEAMRKVEAGQSVTGRTYTHRRFSGVAAAGIAVVLCFSSAITAVAVHNAVVKSDKQETQIEGLGAQADVGTSYYYDLLSGEDGVVYTLTDSDLNQELTDYHAVVWKTEDQGNTWIEALDMPEVYQDSELFAGDLYQGAQGLEAVVILEDWVDSEQYVNRVIKIWEDDYVEYDMTKVYEIIEDQNHLFNVKYVNDHILALVAVDQCLMYDTESGEIVKTLPYDLTKGCLQTEDAFIIYGDDVYTCVDAETLNEKEAPEGLSEFVQMMYRNNDNQVMPPMCAQDDRIVSVTRHGIFEFKDGDTAEIRDVPDVVEDEGPFNGLLPICKSDDGKYYVSTLVDGGMYLWVID